MRLSKKLFAVLCMTLLAVLVFMQIHEQQNGQDVGKTAAVDEVNSIRTGLLTYSLKLSKPAGPTEIKALQDAGAQTDEDPGGETFLIRTSEENLRDIEKLSFVEWVKTYSLEDKLDTSLTEVLNLSLKDNPGESMSELPEQPAQDNAVKETNKATEEKDIIINILAFRETDKSALAEQVNALNGKVLKGLSEKGTVLRVSLPVAAVKQIADCPMVIRLEQYSEPGFFNDRATAVIGAEPLWAKDFVRSEGLTGKSEIVAVADSGLDTGIYGSLHSDFQSLPGEPFKVVELTSVNKQVRSSDPDGHGTHMAGTVLGNGSASGGKFKGVAPGARLYVQSLLNAENKPDPPANLNELFNPAFAAGARIHLNSWGGKINAYLSSTAQVDEFVRSHPDFLPVFSAGNSGVSKDGKGTLSTEANSKNALVVGASENPRPGFGTDSDRVNHVVEFSSRGPTADGRIKPDLVAPGSAVISTASSLIKGNYKPNKYYTRADGTSSAAALVAGASALLREYFKTTPVPVEPSAALIRASLINGAELMEYGHEAVGFGLLNLQATVLSLKEGSMIIADNRDGVGVKEVREYAYKVTDSNTPLKLTLAWTDPVATPSSPTVLVNNLDLVVIGPGGKKYFGNDFANLGKPDKLNNVEQVFIKNPQPGTYTVQVAGTAVTRAAAAGSSSVKQDYALVYGQPLPHTVLASSGSDNFFMANGARSWHKYDWKLAINGKKADKVEMTPGADIYLSNLGKGKLYMSYRTEAVSNVHGEKLNDVSYILQSNNEAYDGGFRLAGDKNVQVKVNDKPALSVAEIPPGSDVLGVVNPSTGELWQVKAAYKMLSGELDSFDREKNILRLKGDATTYQIGAVTGIRVDPDWREHSLYDSPFGSLFEPGLESAVSGSPVAMVVSPWTREVGSITVKVGMLSGVVDKVNVKTGEVTLIEGNTYKLPLQLERDGANVEPKDLRPGDKLEALADEDEKDRLSKVKVYSTVVYGRLVDADAAGRKIIIKNEQNRIQEIPVIENARIFRQHIAAGLGSLEQGDWVRLVLTPFLEKAVRIDAVYGRDFETEIKAVVAVNPISWQLQTASGNYLINEKTRIYINGLLVKPLDLVPGESATITSVTSFYDGSEVLAVVAVRMKKGLTSPKLSLNLPSETSSTRVKVTGQTAGQKVYLYVNEKYNTEITVDVNGDFAQEILLEQPGIYNVKVIAVKLSGAVNAAEKKITRISNKAVDIKNHWAERQIHSMLTLGAMSTDNSGNFNPNLPITRGEFIVILVKVLDPSFQSAQDYPEELPYLKYAVDKGLLKGDGDGNLFADRQINRAEAVVLLMRSLKDLDLENPKRPMYLDWEQIPIWARDDIAVAYNAGIFVGRTDNTFDPGHVLTRAEVAASVSRVL